VEANLVYKAADAFLRAGRIGEGVAIRLEKRIPPGAGLGGGSSDAGATLRGLRSLFPGSVGMRQALTLAGTLGSDVPFFLSSSPLALAWGRGDRVLPLPPLPPAPVLLALPPLEISTPGAYELLVQARKAGCLPTRPRMFLPESFSSWESVARLVENDFEEPIFREHPRLAEIRNALQESGPLFSLLSGSGSALFGVFPDDQAAGLARDTLSHCFPEARFLLTRTGSRAPGSPESEGG
jgi:4-diphosphocytidyl-2-C-methyl-D-erythritol kinase